MSKVAKTTDYSNGGTTQAREGRDSTVQQTEYLVACFLETVYKPAVTPELAEKLVSASMAWNGPVLDMPVAFFFLTSALRAD